MRSDTQCAAPAGPQLTELVASVITAPLPREGRAVGKARPHGPCGRDRGNSHHLVRAAHRGWPGAGLAAPARFLAKSTSHLASALVRSGDLAPASPRRCVGTWERIPLGLNIQPGGQAQVWQLLTRGVSAPTAAAPPPPGMRKRCSSGRCSDGSRRRHHLSGKRRRPRRAVAARLLAYLCRCRARTGPPVTGVPDPGRSGGAGPLLGTAAPAARGRETGMTPPPFGIDVQTCWHATPGRSSARPHCPLRHRQLPRCRGRRQLLLSSGWRRPIDGRASSPGCSRCVTRSSSPTIRRFRRKRAGC